MDSCHLPHSVIPSTEDILEDTNFTIETPPLNQIEDISYDDDEEDPDHINNPSPRQLSVPHQTSVPLGKSSRQSNHPIRLQDHDCSIHTTRKYPLKAKVDYSGCSSEFLRFAMQ